VNTELDHLVVVAHTLEQGVAWCEATLGVTPGPGGTHALMGTHNRLLAIGGEAFPRSFLEVIAIDPNAPPPGRARWFGMDEPALQAAVMHEPRLVHAVLRSPNVEMMRWGLINRGLNPGTLVAVQRGALRWRILLRDDGQLECDGTLPTLIEWAGAHPTDAMPASGVQLRTLQARELPTQARDVLRWRGPQFLPAPAPLLCALFDTPRGPVELACWPTTKTSP
jgi:Glyoxalase-like domain